MRPTSLGVECVSATWRKRFSSLPAAAASSRARHVVLVRAVVHDLANQHVDAACEASRCSRSTPCRPRSKSSACSFRTNKPKRAVRHARDEALGVVRVRGGRHDDLLVREHAHGLVAGVDVVAEEQRFRLRRAAFVDRADLDVGAREQQARLRRFARCRRDRRRGFGSPHCPSTGGRASRRGRRCGRRAGASGTRCSWAGTPEPDATSARIVP